jgi:hypothetical protein
MVRREGSRRFIAKYSVSANESMPIGDFTHTLSGAIVVPVVRNAGMRDVSFRETINHAPNAFTASW